MSNEQMSLSHLQQDGLTTARMAMLGQKNSPILDGSPGDGHSKN
jgi:hypothetical protein